MQTKWTLKRENNGKRVLRQKLRTFILGAIFHQKRIQKSMQVLMTNNYGHLWENASKMMPKRCPKSMTNLWHFVTRDFLFFVKSITLKSFFTWSGMPEINNNSIKKLCNFNARKRYGKKHENAPKWIQHGSRNQYKSFKKWGSKMCWFFGLIFGDP